MARKIINVAKEVKPFNFCFTLNLFAVYSIFHCFFLNNYNFTAKIVVIFVSSFCFFHLKKFFIKVNL